MSFPRIITFNVGGNDAWLRARIRGEGDTTPQKAQTVIVQDGEERDRVCAAMANLKYKRGLPFGGSISGRWNGWEKD